jgi:hypothetical protein
VQVVSFNSEKVSKVIKDITLSNANILLEFDNVLFFGTQNIESAPFIVNCMGNGYCTELKFTGFQETAIMEFGFLKPGTAFIIYNHNTKT